MVTTTGAKAPPTPKTTTAATSTSGTPAATAQQDARLLRYTRENIQPIVAGLLAMAAACGEKRDWAGMTEYQTLSGQLSTLGGLNITASTATSGHAMAAGAGR